jgi:glycosyltransferase involved in cell wall biosynthesis
MKIAILSSVAWRTPPSHYGPWEQIASSIADGLVEKEMDVTLFATKDSITSAKLDAVIPRGYEDNKEEDAKVSECLHISNLMEKAGSFDIIHNHFDFLPLTYSALISTPVVTTIHGFSSPKIIPVFKKYNNSRNNFYVSISNADRSPELSYLTTVYNGIDKKDFSFNDSPDDYLLFFGRIHSDKGAREAIDIAKKAKRKLIISGIIQDQEYFDQYVAPFLNDHVLYAGVSGPKQRNELLGNAYALLHPINFNEPFGLSVAEAMMCGTPVIAFNKGSMSELVVEGKTGFLVNTVDEAVEKIKSLKQIIRKYCRQWAEKKFSKEQMVDNYLNVYKKILAMRNDI